MAWHNRQAKRGAQLVSLFMAWRFERAEAKRLRIWSLMARMASAWRDEDREAGRQSHLSPAEAVEANARYWAKRYRC